MPCVLCAASILRTELYALDGTERQDRPFTVTENRYGVREETSSRSLDDARLRIFFSHALAQRTTQWERGDDPMTQFTFTGDYDEYGQPRSQTALAVPRGRDFRIAGAPGEPYLATHTITDHVMRDAAGPYITDRVARTTSYEIVNDGSLSVFALYDRILDASASRRLIGADSELLRWSRISGLTLRTNRRLRRGRAHGNAGAY